MDFIKTRLQKFLTSTSSFRKGKERISSIQAFIGYICSTLEGLSAFSTAVLYILEDFPGRSSYQLLCTIVVLLMILFLTVFDIRGKSFRNKTTAIVVKKIERRIERLLDILRNPDSKIEIRIVEEEYASLCETFDNIDLSDNAGAEQLHGNDKRVPINDLMSLANRVHNPLSIMNQSQASIPSLPPPPPPPLSPSSNQQQLPPPPFPGVNYITGTAECQIQMATPR